MAFFNFWGKRASRGRKRPTRGHRALALRSLGCEPLESRHLLSVTLNPITGPDANSAYDLPSGKDLYVPLTGTDTGQTISYQATSSDPNVQVSVLSGNPTLTLNVSGTDSSGNAFSGAMTIQLFENLAPNMVQQIESLVNSGYYNGKSFYRIVPGFVAQGGFGPSGDPNATSIAQEMQVGSSFNSPGLLAMANTGQGSSNTTEFFITDIGQPLTSDPTYLNYGFTIFGQLTSGFNIYNDIMNAQGVTSSNSSPTTPVTITSATIEQTDTQNGVLQISAPNNFTGNATINVTATGTDNTTAQQSFAVDVAPDTAGSLPRVILSPVANQVIQSGQSYSFQISATDSAGGTPQFGISDSSTFNWTPFAALTNATVQVTGSGNTQTVTITPNAGFTGTMNLTAHADDNTNNYHDAQSFSLTVVGPITVTAPSTQTVKAVGSSTLSGVSVTDPGIPSTDTVTFTLGANDGTFTLSTSVAGGITGGQITGNGTGSVSISAPLAAINATLTGSGLSYTPNTGFSGTDTFTLKATDTHSNSNTINPSVSVVGPLTLTVPSSTQVTPIDTALPISGISIVDANLSNSSSVAVTLSVADGVLNLLTYVSGGITSSQISGNGTANVSITAPLSAINATLTASGGAVYTPNTGFNGADTLNLSASDSFGNGDAKTITIATGLTVTVPGSSNLAAGGSLAVSGISIGDPALASTDTLTVVFAATNGTVALSTAVSGGISSGEVTANNSGSVSVTATLAEINATLAATGGITYSPNSGYNGPDSLSVSAGDNLGGSNTGSVALTVVGPLSITLPTGTQLFRIGAAASVTGLSLSDPSIPSSSNITLTLSVTDGTLALSTAISGGLTSSQISGSGTNSVTITAPLSAINATLAAANGLTYTPNNGFAGADTLSATAQDPVGNNASNSVAVAVVGPLNVTVPSGQQAVAGGGSLVVTGLALTDPSLPVTQEVTVTIAATHGLITLSTTVSGGLAPGDVAGNGTASVTITATIASINATLADPNGMTYAATAGYNGADAIAITANDLAGNAGMGNVALAVGLTITAPTSQLLGTGTTASVSGISLSDSGLSSSANITLTLSVAQGTLNVSTTATGGITASQVAGNGTGTVTITAPLAAINATLAATSSLNYTPTSSFAGADNLSLSASDPSSNTNTASVALTVAGPITVTAPTGQQSATPGGSLSISGVSITDTSLPTTSNVTVTLSAAHGTVSLSTSTSGGITTSQVSGNGSGSVTITAPLAAINATLAANGGLTYVPTSGYSGADSVSVAASDTLGNTHTNAVTINIAAQNTATLSGEVFEDGNTDGLLDDGESLLAGVIITLTGTDSQNNAIGPISVKTDSNGAFQFANLVAGTYTLTKNQPTSLSDGVAAAGSLQGSVASDDVISGIVVATGASGTSYNFSEQGLQPQLVTINMFLSNTGTGKASLEDFIAKAYLAASTSTDLPVGTTSPVAAASAPTASAATSSFQVAQSATLPVTGVTVADNSLSNASGNVQVTMTVSEGTLNVSTSVSGGIGSSQVSGAGTGSVIVTAPLATINSTFAATNGLTYTPASSFTGNDSLSISISDLGNNSSGTPLTGSQSIALSVIGAPTVTTFNPSQTTTLTSALPVTGVSIADAGLPTTANVTLSLSVASGTLGISTIVSGGLTSSQISGNSTTSVVITAPLAAINATLAATNGLLYTAGPNFTGQDALSISASNSLGSSGTGSVSITVTSS